MLRVMRVRMSTSDGSTSDRPGLSNTSSKVNASTRFELLFTAIANSGPSQRVQAIPAANTCANIWTLREDLAPSPESGPHFGLAMVDSTSRWRFIGHSQPSTCTGFDRPRGAIGSPSPEALWRPRFRLRTAMIRASHRSLVLLLAASAVLSKERSVREPAPNDEQRCTGAVPVPPQAQADACTALIGSKRYRGQNLAILTPTAASLTARPAITSAPSPTSTPRSASARTPARPCQPRQCRPCQTRL